VLKTQKVIDPAASADAVLSQSLPQQVENLMASELNPFDQAHHHPHVGQHGRSRQTRFVEHHAIQPRFKRHGRWVAGGCLGWCLPRIEIGLRWRGRRKVVALAAAIESFLLRLPGRCPVVRGAPLAGTLLPMMLPATEGTTQVPPTCVAGMREKANPTVRAVSNASQKLGMRLQHRVQRGLILSDKRPGAIVLVPIRAKREKLLDRYGKKARLSAIMLMVVDTPSSYLFDAKASRGGARFFVRDGQESAQTVRTNSPAPIAPPGRSAFPVGADSLPVTFSKRYLEEGRLLLPSK
jgi:hypothetical protein